MPLSDVQAGGQTEEARRDPPASEVSASPLEEPLRGALDTLPEVRWIIGRVAAQDPTYGPAALAILAAWAGRVHDPLRLSPKELGELAAYLSRGLKAGGDRYARVIYSAARDVDRAAAREDEETSLSGQVAGWTARTAEDLGIADDTTTEEKPLPWPAIAGGLLILFLAAPQIGEAVGRARGRGK